MSRSLVALRAAVLTDAPVLAELWGGSLRKAERVDQVSDLEQIIKNAAESAEQRLLVAEYDGEVAGAVMLRLSTISALNLEQTVQTVAPFVFPQYRRHGIGRQLMESAVAFAEELGVSLVSTAASSGSRDANRFLARLTFAPHATFRLAPTVTVRAKIEAQRPAIAAPAGSGGRQLTKVLAARRSMRRSQSQAG